MTSNNGRAMIGVIVIFIGAVIYYCNSRINRLEASVQKQHQILSSFIANIHNKINQEQLGGGGAQLGPDGARQKLSSPEADESAKRFTEQQEVNNDRAPVADIENKIEVSDDSDSDVSETSSEDTDSEHDDTHEIIIKENTVDNANACCAVDNANACCTVDNVNACCTVDSLDACCTVDNVNA